MKLSSRQDIEASTEDVFRLLSDFQVWERAAMRRGAEVTRLDALRAPGVGMAWQARFDLRGKRREVTVRLTRIDAPSHLAFSLESTMVEGAVLLDLFEMSANRCRLHVALEVKPRTLAARLVLQSLRLARQKVEKRFDQRVALMANDIEQRLRGPRV